MPPAHQPGVFLLAVEDSGVKRVWLLLVLTLWSCAEKQEAVVFDFAAQRYQAQERAVAVPHLDIGSREAVVYCRSGWSDIERANGTNFCWANASSSKIYLLVHRRQPLRMRFRCRPFPSEKAQTIELVLNEHRLPPVQLSDDWNEYEIALPAEALVVGINKLQQNYAYVGKAAEVSKQDDRQLAVCWDWLELLEEAVDRAQVSDTTLTLAAGGWLDYHLKTPLGAELKLDGVLGEGILEIEFDRPAKTQRHQLSSGQPQTIILESQGVYRFRFQTQQGMSLGRPRLCTKSRTKPIAKPKQERRPNIVVYLVDTTRVKALSEEGPNFEQLAQESIRFEKATAQSSFTKCSVASLFTGLSPVAHGTNDFEDKLPPRVTTLAERLSDLGYLCQGFSANGFVSTETGFDQGFAGFQSPHYQRASELQADALNWLDRRQKDKPFFLYLHTLEPHAPYTPPVKWIPPGIDPGLGTAWSLQAMGRIKKPDQPVLDDLIALYRAELREADFQLGEFLAALKTRGLYDDCLFLFLSDHGEEFYEHGHRGHSASLYGEVLDVPLLLKLPGKVHAGRKVQQRVQHTELASTITDYLGEPAVGQGRSLLPLLDAGLEPEPVLSYLQVHKAAEFTKILWYKNLAAVTGEDFRLMRARLDTTRSHIPLQLFDLTQDPGETNNIANQRPILTGYGLSLLRNAQQRQIENKQKLSPAQVKERLESLQYIH